MITNEQMMEKLTALETLLSRQAISENSKELWSLDEVAEYFGYSKRHIQAIMADPYFPKPVQVPSQRNIKQPTNNVRYFVGDIVRYAQRRQRRN